MSILLPSELPQVWLTLFLYPLLLAGFLPLLDQEAGERRLRGIAQIATQATPVFETMFGHNLSIERRDPLLGLSLLQRHIDNHSLNKSAAFGSIP